MEEWRNAKSEENMNTIDDILDTIEENFDVRTRQATQARQAREEVCDLRHENEQLKAENQRLRGQLSTTQTWPNQT
jgi:regulator of replication initiation timing